MAKNPFLQSASALYPTKAKADLFKIKGAELQLE